MKRILPLLLLFLLPMLCWSQKTERNLGLEQWLFSKKDDSKWLPAKVPGTVHTDLLANKIIADPFAGSNEKDLQWIENDDWQYQTTFKISQAELNRGNCILQFDGLDTYAEVLLNGTNILSANNMFRTWKVDVKKLLKKGKNKLVITFHSSVGSAKIESGKLSYTLPGDEKIFVRKAQYQFGWDWGPRFVTAGIWKKASLYFYDDAVLSNVRFDLKSIADNKAKVQFIAEIYSKTDETVSLKANDKIQKAALKKGQNSVILNYEIQNPKLWWCKGLGEPYLYNFEISLLKNNRAIDSKKLDIGLRMVELVQDKDKIGRSFYFKVNGVPVFMKGANVIPPDSFLPRATDSVYNAIVKNAAAANMNMLRVWGGSVYLDDAFYNACDRNGILVWQDFMFACAMYPGDEAFLQNVKEEIKDNVTRLQNHPSIALWCGNNEIDEGWHNWGWQKQYNYTKTDSAKIWNDYRKLFHELIPQTLDSLLPKNENRYWPSSPSIGWGRKESLLSGDSHYWGVWWGMEPFETYERKVGRFMSEYGFQGMPDIKTFRAFAKNEETDFNSEAVKNHQKHPTGYKTINEYMARDYIVPQNFEDYIYVSQLLQADGMKTAIDAHRTAKPDCMGTLYWQLNDCWPVTSWSSVDYFGRWKALQYQVKRSFEDVMLTVKEDDKKFTVYIVNDSEKDYSGTIEFGLIDFNGNGNWNDYAEVTVPANSALPYFEITKFKFRDFDLKQYFLSTHFILTDKSGLNEKKGSIQYYFVRPKELQLTKPNIQIKEIDALTYEIRSDVLAKNVFLYADEDVFFSDNFFDVIPNEKVIIQLSRPVNDIMAKSLFDTLSK